MPDSTTARQLTLDVVPHPELVQLGRDGIVVGTLKIAGEYRLDRDLRAGDELTVTIADADGEVIAHGLARVGPVTLSPIEEKDAGVIGTERAHRAKVVDA